MARAGRVVVLRLRVTRGRRGTARGAAATMARRCVGQVAFTCAARVLGKGLAHMGVHRSNTGNDVVHVRTLLHRRHVEKLGGEVAMRALRSSSRRGRRQGRACSRGLSSSSRRKRSQNRALTSRQRLSVENTAGLVRSTRGVARLALRASQSLRRVVTVSALRRGGQRLSGVTIRAGRRRRRHGFTKVMTHFLKVGHEVAHITTRRTLRRAVAVGRRVVRRNLTRQGLSFVANNVQHARRNQWDVHNTTNVHRRGNVLLLRPHVRCTNVVSILLGIVVQRFVADTFTILYLRVQRDRAGIAHRVHHHGLFAASMSRE